MIKFIIEIYGDETLKFKEDQKKQFASKVKELESLNKQFETREIKITVYR